MGDYICTKCHHIGKPKRKKRGSTKAEFFCWLLFPFGLPYTFWRMLSKYNTCRYCDDQFLISVNSPSGKKLTKLMLDNESIQQPANLPIISEPLPITQEKEPGKTGRKPQDPNAW